MIKLKLTGLLGALLFVSCFTSCERKQDVNNKVSNNNIVMTRSNNVPATSTASGTITATLDRNTKTMSYTVTWTGLSSNPVAMHIHGLAGDGMIALPSPLGPWTNGIAQTISGFKVATAGSYSGTLYVDGVAVKEADLIAGQYYFDIHTVNYSSASLYPAGELRGQFIFAK